MRHPTDKRTENCGDEEAGVAQKVHASKERKKERKKIDEYGFSARTSSLLVVNQKFSHCLCHGTYTLCRHTLESLRSTM